MVGVTWRLRSCGGLGSESQAAVVSDSSCTGGSAAVGVSRNSASVTVSQLSRYIRTNWGFLIPDGSFNPRLSSIRLRSLAVDQFAGWSTAHLSIPADTWGSSRAPCSARVVEEVRVAVVCLLVTLAAVVRRRTRGGPVVPEPEPVAFHFC